MTQPARSRTFELPESLPFPMPQITLETEFFWESGADGTLRLLRCQSCAYFVHPPSPRCPRCGSSNVAPEQVSGRGVVYSFSIAVQAFIPGLDPYCVGMIEIAEQDDVRIIGPIVGCTAEEVAIGLPVTVAFLKRSEKVWMPYFRVVTA
jgi:uncharacterized OB-fold protein